VRGPAPISAALCRYAGPSSRDGGNAARAFSGSAAAPLSRASAHPLEHGLAGRAVQQVYHVDFFNQEGDKAAEADSWRFRTERDHAREQGSKYREVRAREPRRCTPGEIREACKPYAQEEVRGSCSNRATNRRAVRPRNWPPSREANAASGSR